MAEALDIILRSSVLAIIIVFWLTLTAITVTFGFLMLIMEIIL
jgi:hypothetical protein